MNAKKNDGKNADQPTENTASTGVVFVDYRGSVGAAPGQVEVTHTRSPMVIWWPKHGMPMLELQPGLNVIDAGRWAVHMGCKTDSGEPTQLEQQIRDGRVEVLDKLPASEGELNALVSRTIDQKALEYLREHLENRSAEVSAYHGRRFEDRRQVLLTTIDRRLKTSTQVSGGDTTYQVGIPSMKNRQSARLAMG